MYGILSERYLVIEENYLRNMIAPQGMGLVKHVQHKETEIEFRTVSNSFTREELAWYFGIGTEKVNKGLVAIITLQGVMSRSTWFGASTSLLMSQLKVAIENENVIGVVLKTTSPGGAVDGTQSLSRLVAELRSQKPIVSWVSYMAASGALWVTSQSTEIWLESNITSMGSLGVMSTVFSEYEKNIKEGIDVRVLRSKGSENKALLNSNEPLSNEAIAQEQLVIDMIRGEFLGDVRAIRQQVSADIDGAMYYGKNAIKVGFADNIGVLDAAIKRTAYLSTQM